MIVVDSSALVAILENEADAAVYAKAIEQADRLLISAVNVHENRRRPACPARPGGGRSALAPAPGGK